MSILNTIVSLVNKAQTAQANYIGVRTTHHVANGKVILQDDFNLVIQWDDHRDAISTYCIKDHGNKKFNVLLNNIKVSMKLSELLRRCRVASATTTLDGQLTIHVEI